MVVSSQFHSIPPDFLTATQRAVTIPRSTLTRVTKNFDKTADDCDKAADKGDNPAEQSYKGDKEP